MEKVFAEEKINEQISQYLMMVKRELALYADGIPDTLKPRFDSLFALKLDSAELRQGLYGYMRDAYGIETARRHLADLQDPIAAKMRNSMNDSLTEKIVREAQSCLETLELGSDTTLSAEYAAIDGAVIFDSVPKVHIEAAAIFFDAVAWSLRPPFQVTREQFDARLSQMRQQTRYFLKLEPCIEILRNPSEPPEFFIRYGRFLRAKPNRDFETLKNGYFVRRLKEAGAEIRAQLERKAVAG